jgi:hypothetical protein
MMTLSVIRNLFSQAPHSTDRPTKSSPTLNRWPHEGQRIRIGSSGELLEEADNENY